MADKITTCNKENGCYSSLWGRDCWVADSMLKLIYSHADTLYEQSESSDVDKAIKSIMDYCDELRKKNKEEHWPDELHPDLSAPV
jgi:hypothetical protein